MEEHPSSTAHEEPEEWSALEHYLKAPADDVTVEFFSIVAHRLRPWSEAPKGTRQGLHDIQDLEVGMNMAIDTLDLDRDCRDFDVIQRCVESALQTGYLIIDAARRVDQVLADWQRDPATGHSD